MQPDSEREREWNAVSQAEILRNGAGGGEFGSAINPLSWGEGIVKSGEGGGSEGEGGGGRE